VCLRDRCWRRADRQVGREVGHGFISLPEKNICDGLLRNVAWDDMLTVTLCNENRMMRSEYGVNVD